MKGYLGQITELQNMVRDQYKQYQAETAPMQRSFGRSREEMGAAERSLIA